jgi:hypothetical protein
MTVVRPSCAACSPRAIPTDRCTKPWTVKEALRDLYTIWGLHRAALGKLGDRAKSGVTRFSGNGGVG